MKFDVQRVKELKLYLYICNMDTLNFSREQLAQYILKDAKESSLSKIKSIISNENNEEAIVTLRSDGKPLNSKEYIKEIQTGIEDVKSGRVTSDEDLSKEIENW